MATERNLTTDTAIVQTGQPLRLAAASAVLLFAELLVIRWTGSELWALAFFKNLVLIAAFLGAGLGMAIGSRRARLAWMAPALILVFGVGVPLTSRSGVLEKLHFGGKGDFFWQLKSSSSILQSVAFLLVFVLLFVLAFLLFVALGVLVGRLFEGISPLEGYAWNLGGSLIGVLAFAAISLAGLSPAWWLLALSIPLGLCLDTGRAGWAAVGITAVAALAVGLISESATWSPYSRITVNEWTDGQHGNLDLSGWELNVNGAYHMTIVDLSDPPKTDSWFQRAALHYDLPYRFIEPQRVLVLGSGGGNDVAAALRNGARHVDAVEIDPVIVRLGKELHSEKPYHSPAVQIHVDDARSFLERGDQKYDLIVLGLLDSHTLLAGLPGVRLDNYVYTLQAMEAVRDRLSENGVFVLSFAALGDRTWLAQKLFRIIEVAFDEPPLVFPVGYDFSVTYFAGPGMRSDRALNAQRTLRSIDTSSAGFNEKSVAMPTDDWPQLYLQSRGIPGAQLLLVGLLVLASLIAVLVLSPFSGRPDVHFAMLGAGFLLVETKGIADLGLLFGGTWWTVTTVFAAVLVMALLSVLFVARVDPRSLVPFYAGLILALGVAWLIRPADLLGLSLPVAQTLGALLVATPVFFSGVVFSISLKSAPDTARALGSNLLGAVLGGFLEYSSLSWGIRSLSLLAIVLYLLSAVALKTQSRSGAGA